MLQTQQVAALVADAATDHLNYILGIAMHNDDLVADKCRLKLQKFSRYYRTYSSA